MVACSEAEQTDKPNPKVYVQETEDGYHLVRNGEPFYIKGAATHPDFFEELKEAGANTARIYDTINLKAILDKAQFLNLAVAVDIALPQYNTNPEYYEDEKLYGEMRERVAVVVKRFRNHPALLYWTLGNELSYPYFYKSTSFFSNYNNLIEMIHEIDPDHPVSTAIVNPNKLRVLSIITRSPELDFISFNSFGTLSAFSEKLAPIAPIWKGPYVVSEWGVNGPWEAERTTWNAPIEEPSTTKAEQIRSRHQEYISSLSENGLGSFIFYWGQKNEATPTWFSLLNEDKLKTQAAFELRKIWTGKEITYRGPAVSYLLLNGKATQESIILPPGGTAEAELFVPGFQDSLEFSWELREEAWEKQDDSQPVPGIDFTSSVTKTSFRAPLRQGPYRLFVEITNGSDYYATANIPFYVLEPGNEN